ncbi:nucleoside deaminase [Cellulophaga sp. Hel_I_12]|uniref:nucleoside deaminase n=1 Tax=Cellulophaga sp. Hel_I_12 TaxID=1249972 RepID=UPI0006464F13|nr:nucleoside deaminase [Cellulophaga sp. Hel_I_12]
MKETNEFYMERAIALAAEGMNADAGRPFGAVVVKDDEIIAEAYNQVTTMNDPTAHAEIVAMRKACEKLNNFELRDCIIYTSCEPCPMCLGAIYWSQAKMVYYGCSRKDAAAYNFDDQFIYDELDRDMKDRNIQFVQLAQKKAVKVFEAWGQRNS